MGDERRDRPRLLAAAARDARERGEGDPVHPGVPLRIVCGGAGERRPERRPALAGWRVLLEAGLRPGCRQYDCAVRAVAVHRLHRRADDAARRAGRLGRGRLFSGHAGVFQPAGSLTWRPRRSRDPLRGHLHRLQPDDRRPGRGEGDAHVHRRLAAGGGGLPRAARRADLRHDLARVQGRRLQSRVDSRTREFCGRARLEHRGRGETHGGKRPLLAGCVSVQHRLERSPAQPADPRRTRPVLHLQRGLGDEPRRGNRTDRPPPRGRRPLRGRRLHARALRGGHDGRRRRSVRQQGPEHAGLHRDLRGADVSCGVGGRADLRPVRGGHVRRLRIRRDEYAAPGCLCDREYPGRMAGRKPHGRSLGAERLRHEIRPAGLCVPRLHSVRLPR